MYLEEEVMSKDYAVAIRECLTKYGFDDLDENQADDALDSIEGFICDLAHWGWDYDAWEDNQ